MLISFNHASPLYTLSLHGIRDGFKSRESIFAEYR